ncbi:HNH endonuclease signature motif containing protein [Iamia sp.]|uniref:HNH endonuclease signature motif containing protein n=1 Tax=Iamia sp. TaxID=2722710 RepID=UPI002C4331F3|nr:HNH endonuclease signature motif containing protein [Iamia sp.]HXH56600.1 HNH endonuclease signature motif containing protein [Iamia sp.]
MRTNPIPTLTPRQIERFWSSLDTTTHPGGCWFRRGTTNLAAYAKAFGHGAHCIAYTLAHGPIPEGHIIDHRCRNKACRNPAHLEAITKHQNSSRYWCIYYTGEAHPSQFPLTETERQSARRSPRTP